MKWNDHINRITAKANRTLGLVRRNLKPCSRRIKLLAYNTLVRPILEDSSSVWDPHTKVLIDKLEAVQRRAVRFIMNNYDYRNSSVSDMMRELKIESLAFRRKIGRLTNFHKARGGRLAIPVHELLRPVERLTRNSNINCYIPIQPTKDCYKYSFLPRTVIDWNNLDEDITNIEDTDTFKETIIKHYLNPKPDNKKQ